MLSFSLRRLVKRRCLQFSDIPPPRLCELDFIGGRDWNRASETQIFKPAINVRFWLTNCAIAVIQNIHYRPIAVIGYLAHPELCLIGWG